MTTLLFAALALYPDTPITPVEARYPFAAVRVGPGGNDLRISGTADDLDRLANALHEAAASIRETT